ncbi:MAG TPA: hypothetical protein VKP30_31805 [Polyangiaceae bacterium]|nr:hypothetical protein [Polyangiaceae bacterium]
MEKWTSRYLEGMEGRHIYSERDCRVQILKVQATTASPWQIPNGSVLAIVLKGDCLLVCDGDETELSCGSEALLRKGEYFGLKVASEEISALVQLVWMPGISAT